MTITRFSHSLDCINHILHIKWSLFCLIQGKEFEFIWTVIYYQCNFLKFFLFFIVSKFYCNALFKPYLLFFLSSKPNWHHQPCHSHWVAEITFSPHSDVLCEHEPMPCFTAATCLADWIISGMSRWTDVPNKVVVHVYFTCIYIQYIQCEVLV